MQRVVALLTGVLAVGFLAFPAFAGNPHFVGACSVVSHTGVCLTVMGKEAGLGDEDQITVTLTAEAVCVNPGNNEPQAANKDDIVVSVDVPVQNGKANYTITGCAEFQPQCSPPMSVMLTNILVTDETNGLECMP